MARKKATRKASTSNGHAKVGWGLVDKVFSLPQARTIYLWGPPGIGKTYTAYRKGRIDRGVYSITLTEDTPAAELRGHFLPRGSEMTWHDGPFTAAMRDGARLVVNELSHATPEVHALLYPVLESAETAQMTLPTNETVRPSEGFHVVCTDNVSTQDLYPALRDRFDCTLEITEPHPEALARLSPAMRAAALRCFALEEDRRVSLRSWLALDRMRGELTLEEACLVVFGAERGSQIFDAIKIAGLE